MSWFYLLEKRLVDTLLRSPTFTKGVQNIHKRVHTFQHGKPPEYHNPTHLDTDDAVRNGGVTRFFKLLWDELKTGHRPEAPSKSVAKPLRRSLGTRDDQERNRAGKHAIELRD